MQKKFLSKFFIYIKKIINYPRVRIRSFLFDHKNVISTFSTLSTVEQKKELIKLITLKNFLILEDLINTRKKNFLNKLFYNLQKDNYKKIIFVNIYSYLVNICEYRLSANFHELLCKSINKDCFFYYQICTLNKKNIKEFKKFKKSIKFFFLYNFLFFKNEKKYIDTILQFYELKEKENYYNNLDNQFKEYIEGKELFILGPLAKKISLKKEKMNNALIIRFKNNNFLKESDLNPNIIYLNGSSSMSYFKKKNYIIKKKNLDWVIYIHKHLYKMYYKKNSLKHRFADNTAGNLFTCFTELNLLQKVLFDLILFNPKKINLHNFDIKLSRNSKVGYGIYDTLKKQKKIRMSFLHNQIVMFDFIHFLYKEKKINLDKRLKKIITNGKENYLKQLEQTWKNIN
tara:strand:- start:3681 stop:4880 length:1200 start_codon:yes stop_codon:yes gene_type:complete